jgi:phage replication O-like protein O
MADKRNGYTPFPNEVIDGLMVLLSGAEYKILSVIIRQTLGWKKQWDGISLTIFIDKTGLSKQGVLDSIESLEDNKLILTDKKPGITTRYALYGDTNEKARPVNSVDRSTQLTGQLIRQELVNSVDRLREKLVNSVDTQKKGSKETNKTTTEVVVGDLPEEPMLTIKSDATIVEGAILSKYRSQIMDKPPSPNALRDSLELYSVDQLTEAIDRMPAVLTSKNGKSVINGDYALSTACKYAKNTHWGRTDGDVNGRQTVSSDDADELKADQEHLADLLTRGPGWETQIESMERSIAKRERYE